MREGCVTTHRRIMSVVDGVFFKMHPQAAVGGINSTGTFFLHRPATVVPCPPFEDGGLVSCPGAGWGLGLVALWRDTTVRVCACVCMWDPAAAEVEGK